MGKTGKYINVVVIVNARALLQCDLGAKMYAAANTIGVLPARIDCFCGGQKPMGI